MDTQIIEILGRNRLIDQLLRAGLEVATPERDRGIDLIAYVDVDDAVSSFIARPIQMKAASQESFSINRKYEKFPDLILAFVCYLAAPEKTVIYALTYREAIAVAEVMGYTKTLSWAEGNIYSVTRFSEKLRAVLNDFVMTPQRWREKVLSL